MSARDGGLSLGTLSERVRPYRFSVAEVLDLAAGGWWKDEDVELISGTVMVREPAHPPHAGHVNRLAHFFHRVVGDAAVVSTQNPVLLSDESLPVPDLALLAPRADFYADAYPEPADVLLIIEVARTSRPYDFGTKALLYSTSGIAEYWVVDLPTRTLHVHRSPTPEGYAHIRTPPPETTIAPVKRPDFSIPVEAVLW
jgi:hypothetical protein